MVGINMTLNTKALRHVADRALVCATEQRGLTVPVRYKLGQGGMDPRSDSPGDPNNQCDCSGFVAWCLGMSRRPKPSRRWWMNTDHTHRDATRAQTVFVEIDKPVVGCIVVYPGSVRLGRWSFGHMGIVTRVSQSGDYTVTDCASGPYRRLGAAITSNRPSSVFDHPKTIFCVLRQHTSL